MLFHISNKYGEVYDELEEIEEKLSAFNFNLIDYDSATVELNTMEDLIKLIKILGENDFNQKVLVTEDHHIIYYTNEW